MERAVITIEIQSIEGCVLDNPLCNFEHTLICDKKIDSRAEAFTNRLFASVQLMTSMLIKIGRNTARNLAGQLTGTKSIRQNDVAEVLNHRIEYMCCELH